MFLLCQASQWLLLLSNGFLLTVITLQWHQQSVLQCTLRKIALHCTFWNHDILLYPLSTALYCITLSSTVHWTALTLYYIAMNALLIYLHCTAVHSFQQYLLFLMSLLNYLFQFYIFFNSLIISVFFWIFRPLHYERWPEIPSFSSHAELCALKLFFNWVQKFYILVSPSLISGLPWLTECLGTSHFSITVTYIYITVTYIYITVTSRLSERAGTREQRSEAQRIVCGRQGKICHFLSQNIRCGNL